ncbi:MAG: DapH/DapD/GlmU-related protein, partial [bacterium]|nr:DapH/DapD/GlmU-related protein [bacterium]
MSSSIHKSATVGANTEIGHFCVFLENVSIGENCRIGHGVIIHPDTVIGNNVRIDDHAVVGKSPMRSAAVSIPQSENLPALTIGENTLVGTGATLYRGAKIGTSCLIADYASVREESEVGDDTIVGR